LLRVWYRPSHLSPRQTLISVRSGDLGGTVGIMCEPLHLLVNFFSGRSALMEGEVTDIGT